MRKWKLSGLMFSGLLAVGMLAAGLALTAAEPSPRAGEVAPTGPVDRLREGTKLVDQLGHFELSGDALSFYQEDGRRLLGLPNVALERIGRLVAESPDRLVWTVSGLVTEYHNTNYLLVTHVVLSKRLPRKPS